MGEASDRRAVGVVGGGPLRLLLDEEIRRKGLPYDLVAADRRSAEGAWVIFGDEPSDRAALKAFNGRTLLLERPVDVAMEISVIAARGATGEIRTYSAAENLYQDQLLQMTIVPARVDPATATAAGELARETMKAFPGAGVYGIEMVVDRKGAILIKDVAPRLHEAGHFTIEACRTSQFEQQLRAITGRPLGETTRLYSAVTVSLYGAPEVRGAYRLEGVDAVRSIPGAFVHLYGEKESTPGKALGHVTMIDVDDAGYRDALVHRAEHARRMIVQKEKKG